ncbi:MAG: NUDIX hydrolase [Cystobacterineae bacterium]|nr:NUDIX hydrolase [Cystobacterineae bacterium]MCL2259089.1 NUDIX hydrolase [Cystobacterineae bacterium]
MDCAQIEAIEVIEDFSSTARCDEGFLQVRRFWVKNRRGDGSTSAAYRVDLVDRPRLDAVAVLVYRRGSMGGVELLTRQALRPAAYFRKNKSPVIPDGREYLFCEEVVAGLLEPEDMGEVGLLKRAALEVEEEAGIKVEPASVVVLGTPVFVAPGILSEKIFMTAVDVTGKEQREPKGDGSPMEEGGKLRWRSISELKQAIGCGEVQDAKTEIVLHRFLSSPLFSKK